jgi:hypothetical protein
MPQNGSGATIIKSSRAKEVNLMSPEERQEIAAHTQAIAKILYKNTAPEQLTSLGQIEKVVRDKMQEYVMPEVGIFLSKMSPEQVVDMKDTLKVLSES